MPKHVAPRFIMLGTQGTSHRIIAREGEPFPAEVIQDQSPDPTTGLILVDRNPGATDATLSPLVLLQAYQAVLARSPKRSDLGSRYDQLLDQVENSDPDNPLVLSALAKRELKKQLPQASVAAATYLSKAVEKGSKSPQDYMLLAELLFRSNRKEQAVDILKHAISQFPYIPTPYENLSFCYMSMGDDAHAREIVRTGLSIFPSDPNLLAVQRKLGVSP
jgi:tetratricopeptide (TPR) repeat protein